jgi:ABC-type Fe3+/spermidine/putrescine transport system ATPase subunit
MTERESRPPGDLFTDPERYVTHDQAEAMALAVRIAGMRQGRLRRVGTPAVVSRAPADEFVVTFAGSANVLPGRVEGEAA